MDLTREQQAVWDKLTEMIEAMPVDGETCISTFCPILQTEQRVAVKAVRRARLKATKALEAT